jgi:hypothetical protein
MSVAASLQIPKNSDQALRSLVSALEFSSEIIARLSVSSMEKIEAETKIKDALIACNRLNLEHKISLNG